MSMRCMFALPVLLQLLLLVRGRAKQSLRVHRNPSCSPREIAADFADISYCSAAPIAKNVRATLAEVEGLQLVQVQVLMRHGARAAMWKLPDQINAQGICCTLSQEAEEEMNNFPQLFELASAADGVPHSSLFQPKGWHPATTATEGGTQICQPGELTERGFWQHVQNGRNLQEAYGDLLANISSEEAYVRSTQTPRAYGSAVALLTGLFEKEGKSAAERGPFKIRFNQPDQPEALTGGFCTKTAMPGFIASEDVFGVDVTINDICNGGDIPCTADWCLSRDEATELLDKGDAAWCTYSGDFARVSSQPMLKEVLSRMQDRLKESSSSQRLVVYSGHDVSVAPVIAALNISQCKWPPLASHVVFELWASSTHTKARVLYNGELVTSKIPGCGDSGFCKLDAFQHFVDNLLGSQSLAEACSAL